MGIINCEVLITCLNKEAYLTECINSILRQTKLPKSIIVVHDGCENPQAHTNVTTIILPANIGVAKARHEAFRYSTAPLILFLDGDDIISPDYLEKMTLAISKGADIAYPQIYFWDNGQSSLNKVPPKITPSLVLRNRKLGIPVTCLMKREVYEGVGGFKEWPILEDLDFWLRAMCNGYTFKFTQTLLWYRQNGGRNVMDEARKKKIIAEILDQFIIEERRICLK